MKLPINLLKTVNTDATSLFTPSILTSAYCPIDLSMDNTELNNYNIQNPTQCQSYITSVLSKHKAEIAYGGYLEKRNLYGNKPKFAYGEQPRNIHLGVDFWTLAGTKVIAPLDGRVHSFQNNKTIGDYGPTIILKHEFTDFTIHTLYGHLSLESLKDLYKGMSVKKGDILGTLGTPDINVNYAPHLHFQLIVDLEGSEGDYPGVCSIDSLSHYSKNCPDPNLLLRITP
jgi:murein DD-endopeptidase MepM/ murein hydrolase activator NlpD